MSVENTKFALSLQKEIKLKEKTKFEELAKSAKRNEVRRNDYICPQKTPH